jgi:putative membrane protein (TIGR04086 family)
LMSGMIIGVLGTLAGGLAAGLKAGNREIKHGAFVGLGSLIVSFIEQQLAGGESQSMPEWIRMVSVLAVIPAGALGGWLAAKVSGAFTGKHGGRNTSISSK